MKIDKNLLLKLTDSTKERNIYTHKFFLARDIFWQRLEYAFKFLTKYTSKDMKLLDFGGGSGVFMKTLASYYKDVSVIDLDIEDAINIAKYYNLQNVKLIQSDINQYITDFKYDVIVATDVLEHFQDLNQPINFIKKIYEKMGFYWLHYLLRILSMSLVELS
jgi:2-polyprenyl-3-methyl-5-hydroxy-6-metoxy-1,4-benzoquinol methylase